MAYLNDIITMVRSVIYDITEPYTYSDTNLQTLVITTARLLIFELDFDTDYTIDISGQTISPDPSEDYDFISLLVLKMSCLIAGAESKVYGLGAISVKDGPSSIDTSGSVKTAHDRMVFLCNKYEQTKMQYMSGKGAGKAIIGSIVENRLYGNIGNL